METPSTQYREAKRLTFLHRRAFLPHFSPDGAKIVFTAAERGRCDIYIMSADGSDLQCLRKDNELRSEPIFSLDGKQIAYVATPLNDDDNHDIGLMNVDGSDSRVLTTTKREYDPVFSPDGEQIAFVSGRDKVLEVYRMQSDGTRQQRLTFAVDRPEERAGPAPRNRNPIFSPDGNKIVYLAVPLGIRQHPRYPGKYTIQPAQLYCMRCEGEEKKRLVDLEGSCSNPMFSPDGEWLAFRNQRVPTGSGSDICLIRSDGSNFVRLPNSHGDWESFHPDGKHIIFASARDQKSEKPRHNWDLYCISIKDCIVTRLTDNDARDNCPVFSPNGKHIVFCSDRDGFSEIYSMPYET